MIGSDETPRATARKSAEDDDANRDRTTDEKPRQIQGSLF